MGAAGDGSKHAPDTQRHLGKVGVAPREGGFLYLLAPQHHLGAEHAPSKRWSRRSSDPTQFPCPFGSVPSAHLCCFSRPCPFSPHPNSLFLLYLLFLVQWFPQWRPRALNDYSDNDHSRQLSSLLLRSTRLTPSMAPEAPRLSQTRCPRL